MGTAEKIEALTEKILEQDRIIFYLRDQLRAYEKIADQLIAWVWDDEGNVEAWRQLADIVYKFRELRNLENE